MDVLSWVDVCWEYHGVIWEEANLRSWEDILCFLGCSGVCVWNIPGTWPLLVLTYGSIVALRGTKWRPGDAKPSPWSENLACSTGAKHH